MEQREWEREELAQANRDLLIVLCTILETRDSYTAGHSLAVAHIARRLAIWSGLSASQWTQVRVAALLHDIGKHERVFTTLINKPQRLSRLEHELLKEHPRRGADLLERIALLDPEVVAAVRHHHERWDGEGYPDGLAGEEIPIAARIVGLSDALDAMSHDRAYRSARPKEWIREELLRCAGAQFDPTLVQIMVDNLDELLPDEDE
jgi:putative nucleotidyltransferase with HDIG domain